MEREKPVRHLGLFFCIATTLLGVAPAHARPSSHGWDYLIDRLVRDGEPRTEVERVFADPRMPPFDGLRFSPEPRGESAQLYRGFLQARSVAQARECWNRYRRELELAQRATGVPSTLLASLLHVESRCGQNTGRHRILFRLARLAMAGEPINLRGNIDFWLDGGRLDFAELERKLSGRARDLEDIFYPEVRAALEIARRWRVDPLELRGSSAGALGWPQFLPSSVLRFGRDGNDDARVDLTDPADAALSAAEYLRAYGWQPHATYEEQRRALWYYNRSKAYVDTVFGLHQRLRQAASGSSPREVVKRTTAARKAKQEATEPSSRTRLSRSRPRP